MNMIMRTLYRLASGLAFIPFIFSSCVSEMNDDRMNGSEDCQGIYFQTMKTQDIELDAGDEKELTFKVYRKMKDNPEELTAVKVPVKFESSRLESGEKAFTMTDIVFEEGAIETEFTVKFPEAQIGVSYKCSIAVTDPSFVSLYSKDQTRLNFNVTRVNWIPLKGPGGENSGIFCDGLVCEMLNNMRPYLKKSIKMEYRSDKKGIYRILNLYDEDYLAAMMSIPSEMISQTGIKFKRTAIVIDASDPKRVVWKRGPIGFEIGTGDISFFSMVPEFYPGLTSADALYGTMTNGVIKFAPFGIGFETGNGTIFSILNRAGKTKIVLPGYEDEEYDLVVKAGISDKEGLLPISISRGSDIETIKYTIVQGSVPALGIVKTADKIAAGTIEAETLPAKAKELKVSLKETGVYTVVFAGFNEAGKYVANAGTAISYVAKGDEKPVVLSCGLIVSDKYASQGATAENSVEIFISGKDLTEVHYGLFPKALYDSMPEDVETAVKLTQAVPDKQLNLINSSVWSGVIGDLNAGTEYILVVSARNGYSEKITTYTATTEGRFDPLQADYFKASLKKDATKQDFINKKMYLYQYNKEDDKRVKLGEVRLTDGGQMEAEGKIVEMIDIEGIWTAAAVDDGKFKIAKDVTRFVFMDGLIYNWKSAYGSVTAELVNPEDNKPFLHTAPGGMVSVFQSGTIAPIPLSYVGGITKEGNIAFMDSEEFINDDGACYGFGLGMFADEGLKEVEAIVSIVSDFVLATEEYANADKTVRSISGKADDRMNPKSIAPVGQLLSVENAYEVVPADFNVLVVE